jgi:hypothetical protein
VGRSGGVTKRILFSFDRAARPGSRVKSARRAGCLKKGWVLSPTARRFTLASTGMRICDLRPSTAPPGRGRRCFMTGFMSTYRRPSRGYRCRCEGSSRQGRRCGRSSPR